MKGVILAGGTGSRLYPLTKVINKHLVPVFNKPMLYYPLYSMKEAGVTDILIITGPDNCGDFLRLFKSGNDLGLNISYEIQETPGGIAQALGMAKRFIGDEKFFFVLGDNLFEHSFVYAVNEFKNSEKDSAMVFLKKVENPSSFGVAVLNDGKIEKIIEKPKEFVSDLAVTGIYFYDSGVFEIIKDLKPSARGELEITDVNNFYIQKGSLKFQELQGYWADCGESYEALFETTQYVKDSFLSKIDDKLTILSRE